MTPSPRRYRYVTADVFTEERFGGNPLAVVTDGRGLSAAEMQAIAREFNLAETVFVLPADDEAHFRRLRIFTPAAELPFAGHPTVGAACVLAQLGQAPLPDGSGTIVLEEQVGPIAVEVRAGALPWARFTLERAAERTAAHLRPGQVAGLLSLPADEVAGSRCFYGSTGLRFLFVELPRAAALGGVRFRADGWEQAGGTEALPPVYVFAARGAPAADLEARMFAPGLGIAEDPATGSAAAALAGCLAAENASADRSFRWRIAQGVAMGRPSLIEVEAEKRAGVVTAIRVAGHSVLVAEGTLFV